jgi:uridine phosphorylase
METSAIYGLGKLLGHQCLSLNAVVANRVNHTFSTKVHQTIEKLITTVLEKARDW